MKYILLIPLLAAVVSCTPSNVKEEGYVRNTCYGGNVSGADNLGIVDGKVDVDGSQLSWGGIGVVDQAVIDKLLTHHKDVCNR